MANTMQSKIRYPLSSKATDALIKKFQEAYIEENYIFVYSRGYELHDFLIAISKELQEAIIAEHTSSVDYYGTLYVVRYRNGVSETIETKKGYVIYYDDSDSDIITQEITEEIRNELCKYEEYGKVEFEYKANNEYSFKVSKNGDMVEVSVVEKNRELEQAL